MLTISAATIAYANSASVPLVFSANAVAGNGGVINVTLTGTNSQTIGNSGNQIELFANGSSSGSGGHVTFSTGGALSVQAAVGLGFAAGATGASGGILSLTCAGNMSVVGGLDAAGASSNGTITLNANGKQAFLYNPGSTVLNGIDGNVTNASLIITNSAGVTISSGATIDTTGGVLSITTSNLVNSGTINTNFLILDGPSKGGLTIANGGNWGNISQVDIEAGKSLNLGPLFTATAPLNAFFVEVGTLGTLTLNTNTILAQPNGTVGGSVTVEAGAVNYLNMKTQPLVLQANGPTAGGTAFIKLSNPLTIGTSAGDVELNVAPASGNNGGAAIAQSSGNLTVDANSLGTNPNANAALNSIVQLTAGKNLVVNNWSALTIGPMGTGSFTSNSSTPFTIGPGISKNGLVISAGLTGAKLTVANTGGGISLGESLTATTSTILQALGSISESSGASVSAPSMTLSGAGIGTSSSASGPFTITAANLTANGIGKSSNVFISDSSAVSLSGGASAGNTFNLSTTAGGIVTLGTVLAPNVTLTTGTAGLLLNGNVGTGGGAIVLTVGGLFT